MIFIRIAAAFEHDWKWKGPHTARFATVDLPRLDVFRVDFRLLFFIIGNMGLMVEILRSDFLIYIF